ncbi:MAG: hypothetical protein VX593_10350 [Pseudomonadota bacterium]|nr:hypothetical protein [Pseudomonadota bacterium]
MRLTSVLAAAAVAIFAMPAAAQLNAYEDYTISDEVWLITTVKVDANMGDYYLEGLKSTWLEANKVAKELGQISDYKILGSAFPQSGHFNMMLMIKFDSMADLGPSREDYDAFMAAWGEANQDASRETAKTYPELRKITGEYVVHELTFN